MKITWSDKAIAYLTLISGLSISAVAVYYSVAGLVSIFAAAVVPIIVMGTVLELSKLVATVWLKQNWFIAPRMIKAYLLIAVAILMAITSMGIFGYLSKAHLDQAVPTGDVAAKVAILDEKIKTERDNIDAARKALAQMDASFEQTMSRSTSEQGADKAVAIRKSQAKERTSLQKDISTAQNNIVKLNEERAPIASELRKVEAEVGPIKYIAALVYGDNPDGNLLERAVRWVIILIVVVFDPLAVILLLASQYSFQWFRKNAEEQAEGNSLDTESMDDIVVPATVTQSDDVFTEDDYDEINVPVEEPAPSYLKQEWKWFPTGGAPVVAKIDASNEPKVEQQEEIVEDEPEEVVEPNLVNIAAKEAKRRWKEQNPGETIHGAYLKKELGLIDQLPWEEQLVKDAVEDLERPGDYVVEEDSKKKNYIIKEQDQQTRKKTK